MTKIDKEYAAKFAEVFNFLYKDWQPFDYQKNILDDLFVKRHREVFANLSRKSGKSEIAIAFLVAKSQIIPNGELYYISFEKENARKTVWNRFKQRVPKEWLAPHGFKESSLTIHFKNGSTIYLLGSSMKVDALIGTTPDSVVYDEFRAHKQEFLDVMRPNAIVRDHCQSLYISTPPDLLDVESGICKFYVDQMEYCKNQKNCSYHEIPCWKGNPTLQEQYKEELLRHQINGRMAEFQREYEVKLVKGSQDSLLPEFSENDLIPHQDIMGMIKYIKDPIWVVGNDTSGQKRHGHLFMVIDRQVKDIYILDAIVHRSYGDSRQDREAAKMTGQLMWPEIESKMKELNPGSSTKDWDIVWDCHDTPVIDDVHRWHGDDIRILKVNKRTMRKEEAYGLLRDLKLLHKIKVGARASELIDEAKCFHLSAGKENAKKTYDELIDCLRYVLYEYDYLFDADSLDVKKPIPYDAEKAFLQSVKDFSAKQNHRMPDYLHYDEYF